MAARRTADLELVMTSLWEARNRAEKAVEVLGSLDGPAHLVDALEHSRAELAETVDSLAERIRASREAA
jgi:hypothetical protein